MEIKMTEENKDMKITEIEMNSKKKEKVDIE